MALVALEVALDIIGAVKGPLAKVARQDRDLAVQGKRATNSIVENVGEGSRRKGQDRTHSFHIAAGSADEVACVLRAAERWGYVTGSEIEPGLRLIDRELGLLWGLGARVAR